jgi:hypothetical protein
VVDGTHHVFRVGHRNIVCTARGVPQHTDDGLRDQWSVEMERHAPRQFWGPARIDSPEARDLLEHAVQAGLDREMPNDVRRLLSVIAAYPTQGDSPIEWIQAGPWIAVRRAEHAEESAMWIVGEYFEWAAVDAVALARTLEQEAARRSVVLALRLHEGVATRDGAIEAFRAAGLGTAWMPVPWTTAHGGPR